MQQQGVLGQAAAARPRPEERRRQAPRTERFGRRQVLPTLAGVLFLALWESAVRLGLVDAVFLPAPSSIAAAAVAMGQTPEFYTDLWISFSEFSTGFVLALLVAIPLGVLVGWYRRLNYLVDPLLTVGYATPRVVLLPWMFVFFGIDFAPKVVMVFLGVFFPLIINIMAGVRALDVGLVRMGRSFGSSQARMFRDVVLPGSVPFIVSGIRLGIGTGFTGLIIAELTSARGGVGYFIHVAGHTLQTDRYFVGVLVIALAALALTGATAYLERRVDRWRPRVGA